MKDKDYEKLYRKSKIDIILLKKELFNKDKKINELEKQIRELNDELEEK